MTVDYKAEFKDLGGEYQGLQKAMPEVLKAFGGLHKATMGDGVIPAKMKELIALGISINMRCEGCCVSHARSALRAGATLEDDFHVQDGKVVFQRGYFDQLTFFKIQGLEIPEEYLGTQ